MFLSLQKSTVFHKKRGFIHKQPRLLRVFSTKFNILSPENHGLSMFSAQLSTQHRGIHPQFYPGYPQIQGSFPQRFPGICCSPASPRFLQVYPLRTSYLPQNIPTYPQFFPRLSTGMNTCSGKSMVIADSFPQESGFLHWWDMLIHSFGALIHRS
jgi:hypothetical protein